VPDDGSPTTATSQPAGFDYDRMPRWVPRAILLAAVALLTLGALRWTLDRLSGFLTLVLVSLFLSFAIEPAVNRLERLGLRRSLGTLAVFSAIAFGLALFVWAIGAALADQVETFVDRAPTYIEDVQDWADDTFGIEIDTDDLTDQFQEGGAAQDFATRLAGDLVGLGTRVLSGLLQVFTVLLFTYYLVADGPRLRRTVCATLPPERQRVVLRVWELAIAKTGGYIYSRGILALISMLVHWAAFSVIDVPFPLPLALWMGVTSQFVPVVGTYLAGALPVLLTLLDDPSHVLPVLIVILVYQQVENYLISPPITAQTMALHPAVAFGAVIVGGTVLGPVGALLALPASATIQAFASSYIQTHEVVENALTEEVEQRQLTPVRRLLGRRRPRR
jgi:predicted PurR-regulated permease PerM